MGFDLYPMQTLKNKKRWLAEIASKGWLAVFVHDAKVRAAHLQERDGGKLAVEPVSVD
jgi:hypothetical protein